MEREGEGSVEKGWDCAPAESLSIMLLEKFSVHLKFNEFTPEFY